MSIAIALEDPKKYIRCPVCGGVGEVGYYFQLEDGSIDDNFRPCPECGGTGEVEDTGEKKEEGK